MTPEALIGNLTTLLLVLLIPLGGLAAVVSVVTYGLGKATDAPNLIYWGKNAALGAIVLFGGSAVTGILKAVAGRVFGGV